MSAFDALARPCPCGGARLAECCGPFLNAGIAAPTAEALMRSRYTAYVLDRRDHLLETWHASTRPPSIDPPEPRLQWLGLEVRAHRLTGPASATVEFVARSRLDGRATRLHETSRFVHEQGRWFYVDGDFIRR